MGDEFSVFGQLSQLNPLGKPRDSKEVPVGKESRRRAKGKKKKAPLASPNSEPEEMDENNTGDKLSGKMVDIII